MTERKQIVLWRTLFDRVDTLPRDGRLTADELRAALATSAFYSIEAGRYYVALSLAASAACSRKPRYHYDNFPMAFITVFQVMTTDNWPWLMYETYNASGYFALFFFPAVIIIGNIIVLNLFLAILLANFSGDDDEDASSSSSDELSSRSPRIRCAVRAGGGRQPGAGAGAAASWSVKPRSSNEMDAISTLVWCHA